MNVSCVINAIPDLLERLSRIKYLMQKRLMYLSLMEFNTNEELCQNIEWKGESGDLL